MTCIKQDQIVCSLYKCFLQFLTNLRQSKTEKNWRIFAINLTMKFMAILMSKHIDFSLLHTMTYLQQTKLEIVQGCKWTLQYLIPKWISMDLKKWTHKTINNIVCSTRNNKELPSFIKTTLQYCFHLCSKCSKILSSTFIQQIINSRLWCGYSKINRTPNNRLTVINTNTDN